MHTSSTRKNRDELGVTFLETTVFTTKIEQDVLILSRSKHLSAEGNYEVVICNSLAVKRLIVPNTRHMWACTSIKFLANC